MRTNPWTIVALVLGIGLALTGLLVAITPTRDTYQDPVQPDIARVLVGSAVLACGGMMLAASALLAGIGLALHRNR